MGQILGGIVVAVVIAVGVGYAMRAEQPLAWEVYSSEASTRVGEPGENLVGPAWTGENGPEMHQGT